MRVGVSLAPLLVLNCWRGTRAANPMSKAQKLELGLFYAAITLSGAVYAFYELHQIDRLVHALEELMPPFIFLVFVLVICGLFRMAASVLRGISCVCQAAHATLYANYGALRF